MFAKYADKFRYSSVTKMYKDIRKISVYNSRAVCLSARRYALWRSSHILIFKDKTLNFFPVDNKLLVFFMEAELGLRRILRKNSIHSYRP